MYEYPLHLEDVENKNTNNHLVLNVRVQIHLIYSISMKE